MNAPGGSPGPVVLADEDPNGLATLLAGLLESNLGRHPGRTRLLRPAVVEIEATDAGVAVTLRLDADRVEIRSGRADPRSDLSILAPSGDLLDLTAAPLWAGFPAASSREGRRVLASLVSGRVRIRGLLRHPVVVSRVARLLSVR